MATILLPEPVSAPDRDLAPFVGERLWLDFVNSDHAVRNAHRPGDDALDSFEGFVGWLRFARILDGERTDAMLRRAQQQPTGASATLHEARRIRAVLRSLAERGRNPADRASENAITEINRILGRSAGSRRLEPGSDGGFIRNFVTVGDVFAGLLIPIIESAADTMVQAELDRVHRCADPRCSRVFYDASRNGRRRWCDMSTCGNRAKAARHREKLRHVVT